MALALQMRAKGSITIPSDIRAKYGFDEGEVFTLVDLGDGSFLLVPRVSLVPKLVAEVQSLREEAGLTVDDLLAGLDEQRQRLYRERYAPHD